MELTTNEEEIKGTDQKSLNQNKFVNGLSRIYYQWVWDLNNIYNTCWKGKENTRSRDQQWMMQQFDECPRAQLWRLQYGYPFPPSRSLTPVGLVVTWDAEWTWREMARRERGREEIVIIPVSKSIRRWLWLSTKPHINDDYRQTCTEVNGVTMPTWL